MEMLRHGDNEETTLLSTVRKTTTTTATIKQPTRTKKNIDWGTHNYSIDGEGESRAVRREVNSIANFGKYGPYGHPAVRW